jgi:hypothetical protein
MDLSLFGYQHVFSHKPSLLPTVHFLTCPRRDGKKGGLKNRVKSSQKPFLKNYLYFSWYNWYMIHYYQWSHFSSILKSIFLLNGASSLLALPTCNLQSVAKKFPTRGLSVEAPREFSRIRTLPVQSSTRQTFKFRWSASMNHLSHVYNCWHEQYFIYNT